MKSTFLNSAQKQYCLKCLLQYNSHQHYQNNYHQDGEHRLLMFRNNLDTSKILTIIFQTTQIFSKWFYANNFFTSICHQSYKHLYICSHIKNYILMLNFIETLVSMFIIGTGPCPSLGEGSQKSQSFLII